MKLGQAIRLLSNEQTNVVVNSWIKSRDEARKDEGWITKVIISDRPYDARIQLEVTTQDFAIAVEHPRPEMVLDDGDRFAFTVNVTFE